MNSDCPVFVFSNIKHHWLLPGFYHFLDRFWPDHGCTTVSYGDDNPMPGRGFVSIDSTNYPASSWAKGIMRFLRQLQDKYFIMILEDFWLYEKAKVRVIQDCVALMKDDVLRIDLSADRASKKQCRPYAPGFVISPKHAPYQMSFQAAVWNRDQLLRFLNPAENAWQSEINGTARLKAADPSPLVLGSTERPLVYKPIYRANKNILQLDGFPHDVSRFIRRR